MANGNQRLAKTPVEDLRQATTGAFLRGANHVLFHAINCSGQKQSEMAPLEDGTETQFDSEMLELRAEFEPENAGTSLVPEFQCSAGYFFPLSLKFSAK
jgi:hypothetical protein